MKEQTIFIGEGDDYEIMLQMSDSKGNPIDISKDDFIIVLKSLVDPDAAPIVVRTISKHDFPKQGITNVYLFNSEIEAAAAASAPKPPVYAIRWNRNRGDHYIKQTLSYGEIKQTPTAATGVADESESSSEG